MTLRRLARCYLWLDALPGATKAGSMTEVAHRATKSSPAGGSQSLPIDLEQESSKDCFRYDGVLARHNR
jgi:hypothetical protein